MSNELENASKFMPALDILGTTFMLKDALATERLDLLQNNEDVAGSIFNSIKERAKNATYITKTEHIHEYILDLNEDGTGKYDAQHYVYNEVTGNYDLANAYDTGDTYILRDEDVVSVITVKDALDKLRDEIGYDANDWWNSETHTRLTSIKGRLDTAGINIEDLQYLVDLLNDDQDRVEEPDGGNDRGVGAGLASVKYNIFNLAKDGKVSYVVDSIPVTTTIEQAINSIQLAVEATNKGQFKVVSSVDNIDLSDSGLGFIWLVENKVSSIETIDALVTDDDYVAPEDNSSTDEANNYYDEYIVTVTEENGTNTYSYELIGSTRVHLIGYATEAWVRANAKDAIYSAGETIENAITNIRSEITTRVAGILQLIDEVNNRLNTLGSSTDSSDMNTAFGIINRHTEEIGDNYTQNTIKGRLTALEGTNNNILSNTVNDSVHGLVVTYDSSAETVRLSWGTATVYGTNNV